jgi:hypothetical protein
MIKLLRVFIFISLVLLPLQIVSAEEPQPLAEKDPSNLPSSQVGQLELVGEALPTLDWVSIKTSSNGVVTVSGSGKYWANAPTIAYDINVDTSSGTYSINQVSQAEITFRTPQIGNIVNNWTYKQKIVGANTQATNPGIYSARVRLQSYDPPQWTLSETTDYLR